jgi:antitoxin component HigA of HigAB toxin-antitoxin module
MPNVAVIDALNSLLEAEVNSIFHFVGTGSPYLQNATPDMRRDLESMRQHLDQHELELADLIRRLGGRPSNPPKPNANDQYLEYLSLKFLLPKLVDAKELMIERYEHAMKVVDKNPDAIQTLQKHLSEMSADVATLKRVAEQVKTL